MESTECARGGGFLPTLDHCFGVLVCVFTVECLGGVLNISRVGIWARGSVVSFSSKGDDTLVTVAL